MFPKFSRFCTIAALTTLTCVIAQPSSANTETPVVAQESTTEMVENTSFLTTDELIKKSFNYHSGDFFEQSTIGSDLNSIFGWRTGLKGSYPENNIARDGLLLNVIITDYFKQLTQGGTSVRTRDVENPFNQSIAANPDNL
ncbi:MAG: hypothetical protein IGQ45_15385 [Cyanobacterium sp. T60_A2020_053]|nr:hypothetical protein [Cyanobacterium sp. T60_A2020_053]